MDNIKKIIKEIFLDGKNKEKKDYLYAKLNTKVLSKEEIEETNKLIEKYGNINILDNLDFFGYLVKKESSFFNKILEIYYNYNNKSSIFESILYMMDSVNAKKDVILTVEEVNERKKLIFSIIDEYFTKEEYFNKEIEIIKEFLDNSLKKEDKNRYEKLLKKIKQKEEDFYKPNFLTSLNDWIIKNYQGLNDPFYDKLKKFLSDCNSNYNSLLDMENN